MKRIDLSRHVPPGYDWLPEWRFLVWGSLAAFLWSLVYFAQLHEAREALFERSLHGYVLIPGVKMKDFVSVLGSSMMGFQILIPCLASHVIQHAIYIRQGSKSIYLMRRLPQRSERHRRCLLLPLTFAVCVLIAAFLLLLLYFQIYRAVTPDSCLTPDQWQKIWSVTR